MSLMEQLMMACLAYGIEVECARDEAKCAQELMQRDRDRSKQLLHELPGLINATPRGIHANLSGLRNCAGHWRHKGLATQPQN